MAYEYDPDDKFGYKDTLPENHPEKVITGVEFDDEFKKIEAGMGDLQIEIDAIVDGGSINEAPADGLIYGRKDKSWVEVSGAGGGGGDGIEEAPETGKPYARKNKSWVESVESAHTHEITDIDGLQDAIDGLSPIDHTHEIGDVDGLNDALDDLAEKITAVTSDIVFGGTYDLANGVVLRSNKEFLVEGQPLPAAPDAPDVFLIVTSDGTFEGEALIRSDWIVSDGVTWIPIPYSSTGSVSWENIVDKPAEFPPADHNHDGDYAPISHNHDADYAPIGHNHDADYAPIDHNHDGDYQPVGDYVTEAPNDGKPYVRKSEAWHEMPSTGGGGGDSLWQQNLNDIYYNDGNVGIGDDNPQYQIDAGGTGTAETRLRLQRGTDDANQFMTMGWRSINSHRMNQPVSGSLTPIEFNQVGSDGTRNAMTINDNGDVLVGTTEDNPTSPANNVEGISMSTSFGIRSSIKNNTLTLNRMETHGDIAVFRKDGDRGGAISVHDGYLGLRGPAAAADVAIAIDDAGNVGIGTDNPEAQFVVSDSGANGFEVQASASRVDTYAYNRSTAQYTQQLSRASTWAFYDGNKAAYRVIIDDQGRVGIGGTPSRSTKEIEEEAEATLRNWDTKDKKPTKAELIKKLTERAIGGGDAKLQVAGEIFSSYGYNGPSYYRAGYGGFTPSNPDGHVALLPVHTDGAASDNKVSLGSTGFRWRDGHFGGTVSASGQLQTNNGQISRPSTDTGLFFNGERLTPMNGAGSYLDDTLDLGKTDARWKDAHFSGSVNVNNVTVHGGRIARFIANPSQSDSIEVTFTGMSPPALEIKKDSGDANFKGSVTSSRVTTGPLTATDNIGVKDSGGTDRTFYNKSTNTIGGSTFKFVGDGSGLTNLPSSGGGAVDAYTKAESDSKYVPKSGNTTISGTLTATDFVATSDERLKTSTSHPACWPD